MTWQYNEIIRSGNSMARLKNYYPSTGLVVLYDIKGVFSAGMTIVGDDSGTSLTLSNFVIANEYDSGYDRTYWNDPMSNGLSIIDNVIYDGNGNFVAMGEHFTGKPSQDYQITYLLSVG